MRVCICSPHFCTPETPSLCPPLPVRYKHLGSLGRKITDHQESKVSLGHITKPCQRKEGRRERRDLGKKREEGGEGGTERKKRERKERREEERKTLLLCSTFLQSQSKLGCVLNLVPAGGFSSSPCYLFSAS